MKKTSTSIKWSNDVKFVISDVDETIAGVYAPAQDELINNLNELLTSGISMFLISGSSLEKIYERIILKLKKNLRKNILVGHCMGAEVWGYDEKGNLRSKPYYSIYEEIFDDTLKHKWRDIVSKVIREFKLKIHPPMLVDTFLRVVGNHPLDIMFEDRGPQITLELVNAHNLSESDIKNHSLPLEKNQSDLRKPILERLEVLFSNNNIPITPKYGGIFALDMLISGVSKTSTIKRITSDNHIMKSIGIDKYILKDYRYIEIWGDRFAGDGYDAEVSRCFPKKVRSINFRNENPDEFPKGYNIVVWNGEKHLHEGLLEYLKSRHE